MIPGAPSLINLDGLFDKLFKVGLIVGGLYLGRKAYHTYLENKTADAAGGDPNIQAAIEIHQAIDGAGTSEKVLYEVASKISDWSAVNKAYRNKYHTDMLEDIKGDLSPENFKKFLNIYNLSKKDASGQLVNSKNKIEPGLWVFVEKDVNVRKTPKVISKTKAIVNTITKFTATNVIGLAKSGKYLGVTTGLYSLDASTDESVLFIQVHIGVTDTNGKHSLVLAWVASSQVRTEKREKGFTPGSNVNFFTKKSYNNALNGIGAIGADSNYKSELVLNSPGQVGIYDVDGVLTNSAMGKGMILGFKDAEFSKNGKRFYIFTNVQGLSRAIDVKHVTEKFQ